MRVRELSYSRTVSGSNYSNERLGVVVELSENETPDEAFERARKFVDSRLEVAEANREKAAALVQRLQRELELATALLNHQDEPEMVF